MNNRIYICVAAMCLALSSNAQSDAAKKWTLEECILYAIENNISIKQQEQDQANKEIELQTAKYSWLPDLNAGIGQNFDFGRSPSNTGVIVERNSSNSSASAQLSMPVFDGFNIYNNIAASKLNLQAATARLAKAKEDIAIQVASYYMQVLFNKEILSVSEMQKELTAQQVERTQALVDAGRVPLSQLYDIKAQLASDEATLTDAKNNVDLAVLDLAQSLEMERSGTAFDVETPDIDDVIEKYMGSIVPPTDIYNNAVTFKPQIKEQEYLLESQKKMLKVTQSNYYPKLNFNSSYSNGYYHFYQDGVQNATFANQLEQNQRYTLGLTLTIPIFNKFQIRNGVRQSRIAIHNQELQMENSKKVLYKEIQQAFFSATAAQESYRSAEKAVEASKESYVYAENTYTSGKSTVFEFNEAKTKYTQSLAQLAQAKYDYVFRTKILDFYNNVPITL